MKPKVLLVDDEKLNLLTFEAFLADDDYELHTADGGSSGLELARALCPDVILLDVMMPEIDGFTVCRTIRADPVIRHVPIIIVTALHDTASRLEGLRAGADDFVTKPCSRDEIRARVRTIVSLNRFRTIAEQRERFERLFELAPAGIVVTDEAGTITAANPRATDLLQTKERSMAVGQSINAGYSEANVTVLRRVIVAALSNTPLEPQEVREGAGGDARVLRVMGSAVPEAGKDRIMLIFRDVTAEVQAREALEKMNRELDQLVRARTSQLESANSLLLSYASFVSHDLRSPLSVMKGYLSMIQDGAVPLAESGTLVEAAYNATIMMQDLVQNILQLAHDEHAGDASDAAVEVDPTPVIRRVWSHVSSLHPHADREFVVGEMPVVQANALLIERVFYNLLTNAAKYSANRPRPVIEVGARELPEGPAIFVRDNGVGFDSRDADKLFREFSRLDDAPASDGFGLGLSLAARAVTAHGGRMWAEGQAGRGATFYVQFGRASPVEQTVEASAAVT